ncbi:MAG TPA: class I SAM-dependent methyltransferase [Blastocatellia bacterium]|nr:class I SAM-dependent methyltransferase [Blastocatellia bacterium]
MTKENEETRRAWDRNAGFWDARMGEGNDFVEILLWPAIGRLLDVRSGERILDIACGNGLTSRRLARSGAKVVAFDFSSEMINLARNRTATGEIDYLVLDATDRQAMAALGAGNFDAALCNMALMDLAEIDPLMEAIAGLLRPGARFVFSMTHPWFNSPGSIKVAESEERDGLLVKTYSIKASRYMTPYTQAGQAIFGQPAPHLYFHRPLGEILRSAFDFGLVVDGFEERAFPPDHEPNGSEVAWNGRFSEIPPVVVVRLRK